jgi:predicted KAP-like P-loop ATPase
MKNDVKSRHPSEWFSSDRPIERSEEDLLGRLGFSESLADAIRGWSGHESLVLALYGKWGDGKSSIKNMVVESLHSKSPNIGVVDFNPWQLATRPALSEAFFDELGIALGKGDLGSGKRRRSLLGRFRRWAHLLQGSRDVFKATRHVVAASLLILGAATFGSAFVRSKVLTLVLGFIFLCAGLLSLVSRFVDGTIKLLEAGTEVGAKSMSEIKREIAQDMRELRSPILVVLDDLDRLTPQEVIEVFQLIKANGDFPNLIYLLLCERKTVETNIEAALKVTGHDYLKKIVQIPFNVPMIDAARVRQVFLERLNSLLFAYVAPAQFAEKRWANVFWSGLHAYFRTLRDVNRFTSALAFRISSLTADGVFEVNAIDLIVLEAIRLFEPDVYSELQRSKEILTSSERPDNPLAESRSKAILSIIEAGSADRRGDLREMVRHLFPSAEWALGGTQYAREFGEHWYRDLRICSAKMFDRYFRSALSDAELSQGSVQRLLLARRNREELRSELQSLHSRGLLSAAMEELGVHEDEIQADEVAPFVTAIFDVSDFLSDDNRGMFDVPMPWRIGHLVRKALEKIKNTDVRSNTLAKAIQDTAGLFMAADFVALIGTPRESEDEQALLPVSGLAEMRAIALGRIENAAESGELLNHPKLANLLGMWRHWV